MKNELDKHVVAYQGDQLYDFDNHILLNWYPQRITSLSAGATSLLELGLGHGYTANIFSRLYKRHLVLEGSPAIIDHFRQTSPECQADIVATYFEEFDTNEKFDVIVMGFILEHVDHPLALLQQYQRFLAPGGKMFVTVPNAQALNRRLGHLAGMLPDMQALSENDFIQGHQRYYTVESLSAELQLAGYRIDKLEGLFLKPITTSQMLSLNLPPNITQAMCQAGVDYPELSCAILAQLSLP